MDNYESLTKQLVNDFEGVGSLNVSSATHAGVSTLTDSDLLSSVKPFGDALGTSITGTLNMSGIKKVGKNHLCP